MGVLEKKVEVRGDVKAIWQTLLNLLEMNKYQVERQLPYSQIGAKAGSKALSLLLGGTKDGFRDLLVDILPQGPNTFQVTFRFGLPSWTINYPGIKKDCARLAEDLVRRMEHGWEAPAAPQSTGEGAACGRCGASNPPEAAFCRGCGTKMQQPAPQKAAASESCGKCGELLPPGALFCGQCGAKIEPPAPQEEEPAASPVCPKCNTTLPENAKFCLQCGTPLGE